MPKVVDHEARRREIGEAVWRAVARGGMEGATVREIAGEAGFSTGVLAHYFGGKDALILHALRVSVERAVERFEGRMRGEVGLDVLRAAAHEALPLDEDRREEFRTWLQFWALAAESEAVREEQNNWYALWRGAVQAMIEAAQERGELRADLDVSREASTLVALVDGVGLQALFEPDRLPAEAQLALVDAHLSRLAPG